MGTPPLTRNAPIVILPPEFREDSIPIAAYQVAARQTDRMPEEGLIAPVLGLFSETGSLLSQLNKKQRDRTAYVAYESGILEELGDALWFFSNIASRADLHLGILAQRMTRDLVDWDQIEPDHVGTFGGLQGVSDISATDVEFSNRLVTLAGRVGDLVNDFGTGKIDRNRDVLSAHLVEIFRAIVAAAGAAGVSLDLAAYENLRKVFSRWPAEKIYPGFTDATMSRNERLPRNFEVFFEEHDAGDGRVYVIQKRNGIIVGDRLTDNKTEKDDYRFHDIFHMSFAVHLRWSPVLRALFKLKRKSVPALDENEDGARAILIEEGVSTFIFGRGLELDLFANLDHVDYDLLKAIQHFVRGYEVERCALWQWEKAILDGFKVFREMKRCRKGYVRADVDGHTLEFRSGEDVDEDED
jgi:hypothetical protein